MKNEEVALDICNIRCEYKPHEDSVHDDLFAILKSRLCHTQQPGGHGSYFLVSILRCFYQTPYYQLGCAVLAASRLLDT